MSLSAWFKHKVQTRKVKQVTDVARIEQAREQAEALRIKRDVPHRVEYFHQIDDPHSHLAAQCLSALQLRYNISLTVYLVTSKSNGQPRTPPDFEKRDSLLVAPYYDLEFAPVEEAPEADLVELAMSIAVAADPKKQAALLVGLGDALWQSDAYRLEELASEHGKAELQQVAEALQKGDKRRRDLGFDGSATFYYEGEHYHHIDRLYHLENRLTGLNARRSAGRKLVTPRPVLRVDRLSEEQGLVLEAYLALNSPECAVAFARLQRIVRDSGIELMCFPVRSTQYSGPSVESEYERHRLLDLAREAHALGVSRAAAASIPAPKVLETALMLWHWTRAQGKEQDFLAAYYNAVFFDGIDFQKGSRWKSLVKGLGLSWESAAVELKNKSSQATDAERKYQQVLTESGFIDFPLLRLRGDDGVIDIETVGHDRLWLVAKRINNYNLYGSNSFGF